MNSSNNNETNNLYKLVTNESVADDLYSDANTSFDSAVIVGNCCTVGGFSKMARDQG